MATRLEVEEALEALMPGVEISESLLELSLHEAAMADGVGRYPGAPAWVETYDTFWVAGLLAQHFATQPQTTRLSVDGDSIETEPTDWSSFAELMFRRSRAMRGISLSSDGELEVDLTLVDDYGKMSGN